MLLYISILSLGLLYVKGAPQLKVGHTGYELISINDQNHDDLMPLASKLSIESASRYNGVGALNLEKATDSIDEDDGISLPLQQHKRHYESQQSSSGPKLIAESQLNMIDVSSKQSTSQKPNIYLTLGIPRKFTGPKTVGKYPEVVIPISDKTSQNHQPKESSDDSDSREESGSTKISNKKSKPSGKLSKTSIRRTSENIRNQEIDKTSAMFESDSDLSDLKNEEKITAPVADPHRALSLVDAKSDVQEKEDKIESPTVKPGFTMITHFPSIQIHHRKTTDNEPSMFSPIYPSGFNVLADGMLADGCIDDRYKTCAVPLINLHGRHIRIDHNKKSRKHSEIGLDDNKIGFSLGHEINEIHPGSKDFGNLHQDKASHRIPSVLKLNDMNQDFSIPKTRNIISFPISIKPINIQPFPFSNQRQSSKYIKNGITHSETNPIPLMVTNHLDTSHPTTILHHQGRWERIMPRTSIDLLKSHQQGNNLDREYLDSNRVITKSELKVDLLKNYLRSGILNSEPILRNIQQGNEFLPPKVESSKSFVIGIVHEVAPDDSQETVIDVKKENTVEEDHEMHDASQTYNSASTKNSCKEMKPGASAFYEFLVKFSKILLGKALHYELDNQDQNNAERLIDITENKNLHDDDFLGSIL